MSAIIASTLITANVSAKRLVPYLLAPDVEGTAQGLSDTLITTSDSVLELHEDVSEAKCIH